MLCRVAIHLILALVASACGEINLEGRPDGAGDGEDALADADATGDGEDATEDPGPDAADGWLDAEDAWPEDEDEVPDTVDAPADTHIPDVPPDVPPDPACAPSDPTCDGRDDDCDTVPDDDYVPYTCGLGVCTRSSVCTAGTDTCVPGPPPGPDSECDGIDTDCDGRIDEHYVPYTCGIGVCMMSSVCTAGIVSCAPGSPSGIPETICNGADDDCDGSVDENYAPYSCGVGACSRASTCVGGSVTCVPGPTTGFDDDCDVVDDDCDGARDEHWVPFYTCGVGACLTYATCVGGMVSCTPGTPGTDDDCDLVDDDCDGRVDEHYAPYTCGWGPCQADSVCWAGHETCTPPYDDTVWPTTWASYEVDVVSEMNAERLAGAFCNGIWYPPVGTLSMDADLREAARCHSLDMASNDFFSHTGSDGGSFSARCTSAGYTASPRGENIAAGSSTPAAAVAGWMASTAGHCEMIMDSSVNEVGVGYAYDLSSTWDRYWTADFGRR